MNAGMVQTATPILGRLLWPLSVTLVLLVTAATALLWYQQEQRLQEAIAQRIAEIPAQMQSIQNRDIAVMSALLEVITSNEELRAALLARDRERLLAHSQPLFETLRQEWGIAHFYFQDPERYNILRVQFPGKTGGRIDRYTTLEAERTGKTVGGLELGSFGIFILRVVRPVFVDGQLVGYVELGRAIDRILRELHRDPAVEVAVSLHKRDLSRERWETGVALLNGTAEWDRFPDDVLNYSSLNPLPSGLLEQHLHNYDFKDYGRMGFHTQAGGRSWRMAFLPILDASGRDVGDMTVMLDITQTQVAFRRTITIAGTISAAVLGMLLIFLYRLLRRADRNLLAQQADLHRTEALRKAVFDTVLDGIIVIDERGRIELFNPAAERIFGYQASEMLGQNISRLMPEPQRAAHDGHMQRYLCGGAARIIGIGREERGLRKNGQVFPIDLAISETQLDGRKLFTGVVRDISVSKQAERELIEAREAAEAASRAKSEFLSSMSHELRTPMNAILGFSQLLKEDTLGPDQAECVQEILHAGRHLLELINDVLDLSSIESGKITAKLDPVALRSLVESCLDTMRSLAAQRGIELSSQVTCGCCVQTDPLRLRQVLLNLLGNAIKYNRENGKVWIECEALADGRTRISVCDNGIGISTEALPRLFQPFERVMNSYSGIEGAGIGLALSKRLMESMGGSIGVQSIDSCGSTFWIELPRVDASDVQESPITPSSGRACVAERHATVLCIEDNPANARLVRRVLEHCAALSLLEATTAEQGIELAQLHQPDLILLDIGLPGMNGFEALAQLRADPRTREIPVVAVSANAMAQDITRGNESGFEDYLTKPIDVVRFHEVVDRWLGRTQNV
jgi:PAS domain S-box-containing protein